MAEPAAPTTTTNGRPLPALGASVFGLFSLYYPMVALPAVIAALLAIVVTSGRWRTVAILVAGLSSAGATVRFISEIAAPNIVSSGRKAAEDKALSRLRELAWAEALAIEGKLVDRDGDGRGEATSIASLLGDDRTAWRAPDLDAILKHGLYQPLTPPPGFTGAVPHRVEAYLLVAYPGRGDPSPDAAENRWEAYAWPSEDAAGTRRTFFVDDSDRICETIGSPLYSGLGTFPGPGAATNGQPDGACGTGRDGTAWRAWKRKQPRNNEGS